MAAGSAPVTPGRALSPADCLALRATSTGTVRVRSPGLHLVDVAAPDGSSLTTQFIAELAQADGATVSVETIARDAQSVAGAVDAAQGDLIVLVGGTGAGRTDATAKALSARGALIAHGIALQPGRSAAAGKRGHVPVVALPGLPGHALSAYLLLAQPLIDRLCGRLARSTATLPLSHKVSSAIGVAEIALLRREASAWQVLAVGDLPLDAIRHADAWLAIAGDSEGHAAGMPVGAFPLRQT